MGSVYLAEQTGTGQAAGGAQADQDGDGFPAVLARFDAGAAGLALMDHPNIARIYDGGLTPAGQSRSSSWSWSRGCCHRVLRPEAAHGASPAGVIRRGLPGGAARPPEGGSSIAPVSGETHIRQLLFGLAFRRWGR